MVVEMSTELGRALADRFDGIAKEQARTMLEPLVEKVSYQYIFVDRKRAAEMLSISLATFSKMQKIPQIRLVERHLPDCSKTLYEPQELKKAFLSIME
ncbi:hypothetical protein RA086_05425 [Lactiplantibacillus sp. WILCCON 0030]|uniref:DNA-binding protein n=1 Tax=Lactiplantibacillus brownii TaxID=3069269 RepID=A0ABU1A7Y9_9LACO|nr:hypothetical protein [Lactiplantibacillus brownii]MDQ7937067.1 hypothetical protein [Lactiplantibacillus brownii]